MRQLIINSRVVLCIMCFFQTACRIASSPNDYKMPEGPFEREQYLQAPIVIVGVIQTDFASGPVMTSRVNAGIQIQKHSMNVSVENVLRGAISKPQISITYYRIAQAYNGPPPLGSWHEKTRRLLFLKEADHKLRLSCDIQNTCTIPVLSGQHSHLSKGASSDLQLRMAEILLTKGSGVTDEQFTESFAYATNVIDDQYLEPILRKLVMDSSPVIVLVACRSFQLGLDPRFLREDIALSKVCDQFLIEKEF